MKVSVSILCAVLGGIIIASCNYQNKKDQSNDFSEAVLKYDSLAIFWNNKAMELFSHSQDNDSILRVAEDYLEKSIEMDRNYYLAYGNLAKILIKQNRRDSALIVLQTIINKNENYAEGLSTQGFIYDKLEKYDSADMKYRQALQAYDRRVEKNIDDVNSMVNKAFLIMILYGKEAGFREIEKIVDKYPDDSFAQMMKDEIIPFFNREEFLSSY